MQYFISPFWLQIPFLQLLVAILLYCLIATVVIENPFYSLNSFIYIFLLLRNTMSAMDLKNFQLGHRGFFDSKNDISHIIWPLSQFRETDAGPPGHDKISGWKTIVVLNLFNFHGGLTVLHFFDLNFKHFSNRPKSIFTFSHIRVTVNLLYCFDWTSNDSYIQICHHYTAWPEYDDTWTERNSYEFRIWGIIIFWSDCKVLRFALWGPFLKIGNSQILPQNCRPDRSNDITSLWLWYEPTSSNIFSPDSRDTRKQNYDV